MTKEEMQALREMMREELEPINKRLGTLEEAVAEIKEEVAKIKEDTAVTRSAVNALIDWADSVAVVTQVRFPVNRHKAE